MSRDRDVRSPTFGQGRSDGWRTSYATETRRVSPKRDGAQCSSSSREWSVFQWGKRRWGCRSSFEALRVRKTAKESSVVLFNDFSVRLLNENSSALNFWRFHFYDVFFVFYFFLWTQQIRIVI